MNELSLLFSRLNNSQVKAKGIARVVAETVAAPAGAQAPSAAATPKATDEAMAASVRGNRMDRAAVGTPARREAEDSDAKADHTSVLSRPSQSFFLSGPPVESHRRRCSGDEHELAYMALLEELLLRYDDVS